MVLTFDWEPGRAKFEEGDVARAGAGLLLHANPEPVAETVTVGENTTLEVGSVVKYDPATNAMALATTGDSPYGVLMTSVATGPGETIQAVVWRTGFYNLGKLIFDPAVTTDAAKKDLLAAATPPAQLFGDTAPDGSTLSI